MLRRLREIIGGCWWAARFDNPWEILALRHLFRQKRVVSIRYRGMQLVVDTLSSDAHVITEVFLNGMYDRHIVCAGEARTQFNYLNLGANIGSFDIRVFQLLKPACSEIRGLAVEMNPATYAHLVLNLEMNNMFTVRALNAAAWDRDGNVHVAVEQRGTGQRCTDANVGWPVPLVSWRELLQQAGLPGSLDLVKIDIEGAEERVVPHMTAEDGRRIRFVSVETHGAKADAVTREHFQRLGFRQLVDEPGAGETHLMLWKGNAE